MLIAMTRSPLSASISRTVITVSYRIELPTFLDESVFVATYASRIYMVICVVPRGHYLSEDVVHGLACSCVPPAQQAHKAQYFDLQEGICDSGDVVFGAVTCCN